MGYLQIKGRIFGINVCHIKHLSPKGNPTNHKVNENNRGEVSQP
jgi:hypothetical protein